jgi:PKD repeat protein
LPTEKCIENQTVLKLYQIELKLKKETKWGIKLMRKQIFDRTKKVMAIFILVFFVASVTAATASASQQDYNRGYRDGTRDGFKYGFEQCKKDQPKAMSIKSMAIMDDYAKGYGDGYRKGFDDGYASCEPNPVADFYARPTFGKAPLTVHFIDRSKENPTKWAWSFGDGKYSTDKNPYHKYMRPGSYTVKLTVKNKTGSDTETKYGYITVRR